VGWRKDMDKARLTSRDDLRYGRIRASPSHSQRVGAFCLFATAHLQAASLIVCVLCGSPARPIWFAETGPFFFFFFFCWPFGGNSSWLRLVAYCLSHPSHPTPSRKPADGHGCFTVL
jgi:hypothetical protein